MKTAYEMIALDVDGTLLNDEHKLLPDVKAAVRNAAVGGAEIVLCTGRGPLATLPVMKELGLTGTMIVHNGGATVASDTLDVLAQYTMEASELVSFIEDCRRNQLQFDLNAAFDIMVESLSDEAKAMYSHHLVEPILLEPGAPVPEGLIKMSVFGPMQQINEMQSYWEGLAPSLQIIRSGDFFIDIQHPKASKGAALRELAASRGLPREKIFAIGNYFNDISMLEFAGFGVAMDNSPDAVKSAADAVCGSNNEGGVAEALRSFAAV